MNILLAICLGVMSVWDYPARQSRHEDLRDQFIVAQKSGDLKARVDICRKGVALLPSDAIWHYNLACSYALQGSSLKRSKPLFDKAFEELEKAIDLGFRDADEIEHDSDFIKIAGSSRFKELLEDARNKASKPILLGPRAAIAAVGVAGSTIILGSHNLDWDLDVGCFDVKLQLGKSGGAFDGFLYMNRDSDHSKLIVTNYPGLTEIKFDREGRERRMDTDYPNIKFPLPVFGNCSRALVSGPYWRSFPRALMTSGSKKMLQQCQFYLSNQIWVFPAVDDYNFASTNFYGDIFTSVMPYWVVTQGRSWSDQYYLRAALEATKAMKKDVKEEILSRGYLAPIIQMLFRKSLNTVEDDEDYFTSKAHPTAFPPNGLNMKKLTKLASSLKPDFLPPIARIAGVKVKPTNFPSPYPEVTYISPCAWAFILRAEDKVRNFLIQATGGMEYKFVAVHDEKGAATVTKISRDTAQITIDKEKMTWTNRVDVAIFSKNEDTMYGAPSFISFAVIDEMAPYCDPALLPPKEEVKEEATKKETVK